jgi:hypothetical protein
MTHDSPKDDPTTTASSRDLKMLSKKPTVHPTPRIRDTTLGVWTDIGPNCSIGESSIGDGAVIGSAAVVTKDVAPYTIVGGVPAKPIRDRFPREVAERLQRIAWWDWTRDQLEAHFDDLLDLDTFLDKYDPAPGEAP